MYFTPGEASDDDDDDDNSLKVILYTAYICSHCPIIILLVRFVIIAISNSQNEILRSKEGSNTQFNCC